MTNTAINQWESTASDESLVNLCMAQLPSNTAAFDELWRRYHGEIHGFCQQFLRDSHNAADICQTVFIQVFRRIRGFQFRSTFRTWLYSVARNACLSFYRSNSRHDHAESVEVEELVSSDKQGDMELSWDMQAAMAKLEKRQRLILLMRFDLGLSLEEIADQLNLGLSATKMRLYRAQSSLKDILEAAGFAGYRA